MKNDENEPDTLVVSLGTELRNERQRQGLSVETLSKRSGVSFGSISQLERGIGNPSFLSVRRLADTLGLPLARLLSDGTKRDDMVVRADERQQLPTPDSDDDEAHVLRELLTPGMTSSLQVIRSTIPPGFSNEGRAFRHLGTECVVVESGTLTVVHGDRRVELGPGDAMTYPCSVAHWWANNTDTPTIVIGAVTPFEQ